MKDSCAPATDEIVSASLRNAGSEASSDASGAQMPPSTRTLQGAEFETMPTSTTDVSV